MTTSSVIRAPLLVQLYRVFFLACAIFFGSFLWRYLDTGSWDGLAIIGVFALSGVLGFVCTCVRKPWSRWVLASLGILIPAVVFLGMSLMVWSRPQAWWDWLLSALLALTIWFTMPALLGVFLFRERKTHEYFKGADA